MIAFYGRDVNYEYKYYFSSTVLEVWYATQNIVLFLIVKRI